MNTIINNADKEHARGRFVKVVEVSELERSFMSHRFKSETLKIMFWSQKEIELDYCGG